VAFADLDNHSSWGRKCPPGSILVTSRESGPAKSRVLYLAILIGADVAKGLNFTGKEMSVKVGLGNGQDEGKLRIAAAPTGKFVAKRQNGGGWLLTVRRESLGHSVKKGARFTIANPRQCPTVGSEPPCTIISVVEAFA
jgi:hypothetical protein